MRLPVGDGLSTVAAGAGSGAVVAGNASIAVAVDETVLSFILISRTGGGLGQIAAVFFQRLVSFLGILRSHSLRPAHFLEGSH